MVPVENQTCLTSKPILILYQVLTLLLNLHLFVAGHFQKDLVLFFVFNILIPFLAFSPSNIPNGETFLRFDNITAVIFWLNWISLTTPFPPLNKPLPPLFRRIENEVTWIEIKTGEVLIFNQNLPHGNRINMESETRWSMNCRFKSVFTPYGDKKIGEFFEPITLKAASRVGMNYRFPQLPSQSDWWEAIRAMWQVAHFRASEYHSMCRT